MIAIGFVAAWFAGAGVDDVVAGAALRVIGRGFGSGTFASAAAVVANNQPTASARLLASAVVRNAAARADRVTAFLRGESFEVTASGLLD